MKTIEFKNRDKMPILGLGTWKSGSGDVFGAVREAIKMGYRHIDCAPLYMNEPEIGMAIKDAISNKEVEREDLWITSKLWNNAHGSEDVIPAIKKTLADLQIKYLDLWLIHWPIALKKGVSFPEKASDYLSLEEMPISETWKGMEMALEQGLTKHIGVSNFSLKKLKLLIENCKIKPEVNQIELHPLLQQKELVDYCRSQHIVVTAYAPLGSKDRAFALKSSDEVDLMKEPIIVEISKKHNCTPAQILLAWHVNKGTSLIPKSINLDRMLENFKAPNITLTPADMAEIAKMDKHYRYINGRFWAMPDTSYTYENLWDE